MAGLRDLSAAQQQRLTREFAAARELWGPRAALARKVGVDPSTVQVLEGRRQGPLADSMINRITVAIGWAPGEWEAVARGETVRPVTQGGDQVVTDELRFRRPEGISDEEWARIRATGQGYLDALIEQASRER